MLKGKPAGEPEQVTLSAIRSILDETDTKRPTSDTPNRRKSDPAPELELTTQPVKEVETKVNAALFTSVPAPDKPVKPALVKRTKVVVNPDGPEPKPDRPAIPSPKTVARKIFRLPRLPTIELRQTETTKEPEAPVRPRTRFLEHRHIVALAVVVLFAFRPGLVAAVIFLWFFVMVALFLFLGADRIWRGLAWAVQSYKRRNKEGAAKLMDWLDTVALRWDSVLDRFPDGMVDNLYMPDFANLEVAEEEYDAVLDDRLDRMHEQV